MEMVVLLEMMLYSSSPCLIFLASSSNRLQTTGIFRVQRVRYGHAGYDLDSDILKNAAGMEEIKLPVPEGLDALAVELFNLCPHHRLHGLLQNLGARYYGFFFPFLSIN
ncbi:uncharacterized protein LOC105434818 isoform X2 [Cucumis sativus]|uniref:uncharacterized protein LOC105434818 isoform X2 n=1 Tax=Cucumis sativus TaxID=3659 RepID=UPI0012F4EA1E|nr:uncharacterized protein LOC105434818 isoform X2 [Cucumis sativus]